MLNVYIGSIKSDNLVRFNDAWFDRHLKGLKVDANIKYFMKKIDESTYIKEHKMYSRFDKELCVSMEQLSTGCKTLINVYSFNDKIFDVIECGDNVIDEIFRLKQGILCKDAVLVEYMTRDISRITTEQLATHLLSNFTGSLKGDFIITKKHLGSCWTCNCCDKYTKDLVKKCSHAVNKKTDKEKALNLYHNTLAHTYV